MPVTGPDPHGPGAGALTSPDTWEFFKSMTSRAPAWRNQVTLRSIEMLTEYAPGSFIERISPTPLLMVVAAGDAVVTPDVTLEAFNRAREPKKAVILPTGHFDAYRGDGFTRASTAARDWFAEHLGA